MGEERQKISCNQGKYMNISISHTVYILHQIHRTKIKLGQPSSQNFTDHGKKTTII